MLPACVVKRTHVTIWLAPRYSVVVTHPNSFFIREGSTSAGQVTCSSSTFETKVSVGYPFVSTIVARQPFPRASTHID